MAPRLSTLDALLAEAPYGADDDEATMEAEAEQMMDLDGGSSGAVTRRMRGYSWEQLLERVQVWVGSRASEAEAVVMCWNGTLLHKRSEPAKL